MPYHRRRIRVLIADDSVLMRKILSDIINSDPLLIVIATARNGQEAYKLACELKPDVITLDIEMPLMDGLVTLQKIMQDEPTPVIMLSALTQHGAAATIKALENGAVDFIAKPSGSISVDIEEKRVEIIEKVKTAAGIAVKKNQDKNNLKATETQKLPNITEKKVDISKKYTYPLILIGTSTGGPKALYEVLSKIPEKLDAALLIVQHMPAGFTKSLAQRLDAVSPFTVKEAQDMDKIESGCAYIAPGNYQMEICEYQGNLHLCIKQSPLVNGHRPSVDVLMHSAAKLLVNKIGVIMTGMGSDGALGMKALKESGAITIGENAETCIVYGMPKAAAKLGVLDYEVPLYEIANLIVKAVKKD